MLPDTKPCISSGRNLHLSGSSMHGFLASVLLLVGLGVGAAAAWWLRGRELAAERDAHNERLATLATVRGEFEQTMKGLAADALQQSQESFLGLANEVFDKHHKGAAATLDQRQKDIAALLAPIGKTLDDYKAGLAEIEKARAAAYGGLSEEMKALVSMQADASAQPPKLGNPLQAP